MEFQPDRAGHRHPHAHDRVARDARVVDGLLDEFAGAVQRVPAQAVDVELVVPGEGIAGVIQIAVGSLALTPRSLSDVR